MDNECVAHPINVSYMLQHPSAHAAANSPDEYCTRHARARGVLPHMWCSKTIRHAALAATLTAGWQPMALHCLAQTLHSHGAGPHLHPAACRSGGLEACWRA